MRVNKCVLILGGLAFAIILLGVIGMIMTPPPSFSFVKNHYQPSDVWILDHGGHPMESIRTQHHHRSLDWVKWSEVSPVFRELLVQVEDHRFYQHFGVDPLALAKAVSERVLQNSQRGASTLTMQLVGLLNDKNNLKDKINLFVSSPSPTVMPSQPLQDLISTTSSSSSSSSSPSSPSSPSLRRTFSQKIGQMFLALQLEFYWTKEEILEAYINLVPFRGELVGLRAASLGYFDKNPSGLLQEETALLMSLLRAPNATPEKIAQRACRILKNVNCSAISAQAIELFSHPYHLPRSRELIPVLSKSFIVGGDLRSPSSVIQTTLDLRIQNLALNALREQLRILKNQNVKDGAVLILETQTGRVVAYAANGGDSTRGGDAASGGERLTSAEQVDGIQMRRQAGSTIKPFVYATAFDWQILKSNSLLEDSPADIAISPGRVYHPKNYDHQFRGIVSVGDALGSSMNVPAVRALRLVGEWRVLDRLRALGITNLENDDYYGPSLALGAIDLSLWELTHAYRKFSLADSPFSATTRTDIFNILTSPEHRRFTFGMDSLLHLPFPAAVKTGTSKDMRDNWCIGWTPQYTIGVWVGNFNGEPMWNVSGMSGAAPIWRSLMLSLRSFSPFPLLAFSPSKKSLNKSTLAKIPPITDSKPAEALPRHSISRIRYPAPDMLVGLDSDIPLSLQKLPIEIENPQVGHKLFLNGKLLNSAQETTLWPLRRGKFHVELRADSDTAVDSIHFEVR